VPIERAQVNRPTCWQAGHEKLSQRTPAAIAAPIVG
jgi:hypothetical protein